MDKRNTNENVQQDKTKKPALVLWGILLLLLIILTVVTVVGVYLLSQSDGSIASQLKGLGVLVMIIAVFLLISGPLLLYTSGRYVQLPAWRLMVSRFKSKPVLPLSQFKETEDKSQ